MKPLVLRLVVTVLLFTGWLGYLGYLVATRPLTDSNYPLVLSRPQFMTSRIDIVADVKSASDPIEVLEVLWPETDSPIKVGDKLHIADLDKCRPLARRRDEVTPLDLDQPGRYIIPLRKVKAEKSDYEIAPIPTSPGFDARGMDMLGVRPIRIYRDTPEARAQYRQIRMPYEG